MSPSYSHKSHQVSTIMMKQKIHIYIYQTFLRVKEAVHPKIKNTVIIFSH